MSTPLHSQILFDLGCVSGVGSFPFFRFILFVVGVDVLVMERCRREVGGLAVCAHGGFADGLEL